jgi:hypothetical protein
VIQQSDRSDGAQSSRIKHQKASGIDFDHDIVSEFILRDYGQELGGRFQRKGPLHHLLERVKRPGLLENL